MMALLLLLSAAGLPRTAAYADDDTVTLQVEGSFIIDSTRQMLDSINDLRANDAWYWNETDTEKIWVTGLSPLRYDYALERVAMQRAAELAIYYSHTRPDGERCFTAYPNAFAYSAKGENIAYGQTSANEVFVAWAEANKPYDGQGHRRNMLNASFTAVGIGCFECEGVLFWVQEFSTARTSAASDPLTPPVSMEVLRENIASSSLGGTILVKPGSLVELSSITLRVIDQYRPFLSAPCYVPHSAFSIADTGVARIRNGMIEGLQEGETTLTVSSGGLTTSAVLVVSDDDALPLHPGIPAAVEIAAGETKLFSFTPSETGDYLFYSSGSYDTYGYLYDGNMTQLTCDDDGGSNYNFAISYTLNAGTKYYFGARMYSSGMSGTITVALDRLSGGFAYTLLSDGTASVTDCMLTGDVVIPGTLDGYTVSNLAERLFFGRSGVTSVTIPASVTYFGSDREDNDWDYVFSYCYDLQNIYVSSGNPSFKSVNGVLFSRDGRTLINYPCNHSGEVYHVSANTLCCTSFASSANLRFLFLDNPNTVWRTYTFWNTDGLTSFYLRGGSAEGYARGEIEDGHSFVPADEIVQLPDELQRIEADAFRNTAIQYVIVPDGCARIKAGAFTGGALEFARVGASTVVESGAFDSSVVIERS